MMDYFSLHPQPFEALHTHLSLGQIDMTPIFMIAITIIAKVFALIPFILSLGIAYLAFKKRIQKMSPDDKGLLIKTTVGSSVAYLLVVFVPGVFEHISQGTLIGIASLVVVSYLPFAIASLQDPDNDLHWDKQVLMDGVLDSLLVTLFLVFGFITPILLWEASGQTLEVQDIHYLQVLLFSFFITGVSGYVWAMLKIYGWMNGLGGEGRSTYRTKKRIEFLRNLPDTHKTGVWNTKTWKQLKNQPLSDQNQILKIFAEHIKTIQIKDDRADILASLYHNLEHISLSRPEIYNNLFDLAFSLPMNSKADKHVWLSTAIEQLQMGIIEHSLIIERYASGHTSGDLFFQKCLDRLKDDTVDKTEFLDTVTSNAFYLLDRNGFDAIDWSEFPKEWEITVKNLVDKKNTEYGLIWIHHYKQWLRNNADLSRINKYANNQPDIQKITAQLLPEVYLPLWFDLLALETLIPSVHNTADVNRALASDLIRHWEPLHYAWTSKMTVLEKADDENNADQQFAAAEKETLIIYQKLQTSQALTRQNLDQCITLIPTITKNKDENWQERGRYFIRILRKLKDTSGDT